MEGRLHRRRAPPFDNRLALATLRRLDRIAETGRATVAPVSAPPPIHAPALAGGWGDVLEALEQDRPGEALALLGSGKVDEVDDPPIRPLDGNERAELERLRAKFRRERDLQAEIDATADEESVWWDEELECWWTSFPPPPDFDGEERGMWGSEDEEDAYSRECSPGEAAVLDDDSRRFMEQDVARAAARRDRFFASLQTPDADEDSPQA